MTATAYRDRVGTFEAVVLENSLVRAVVVPALGGRVWTLEDRLRGRQWIWHRESVRLRPSDVGDVYDEVWAGGWEELFPNDAPGVFEGRTLPDHGEWWTMSWKIVEFTSGETAVLRLSAASEVVKASCIKEFRLAAGDATVSVEYTIVSAEPRAFHFLFKQHLPIQITPACRLLLPGGRVWAVDPSFGTILPGSGPFEWPCADDGSGRVADLRNIPGRSSRGREFVYVSDLPEGWCAVADAERRAMLRLNFDRQLLQYVWLFLSYGGWRDTYTAVLEPCTNMPKELTEAVCMGQSAQLGPGAEFRTTVSVTLCDVEDAAR